MKARTDGAPDSQVGLESRATKLLEKFRRTHDADDFADLYCATARRLSYLACQLSRKMGCGVDPDDLVATFMVKLFASSPAGTSPIRHFFRLAWTSMRNDALSQHRSRQRSLNRHLIYSENQQTQGHIHDPSKIAELKEEEERLNRSVVLLLTLIPPCFEQLSHREQSLLRAKELEAWSYDQIASRFSIPRGQVGMAIHRARRHLISKLLAATGRKCRRQPRRELVHLG